MPHPLKSDPQIPEPFADSLPHPESIGCGRLSQGDTQFHANLLNGSFTVLNTVVNGINKIPNQTTAGEGPKSGEEVEISITFTTPILLPAGHYFFRPEVLVTGGDFLYLSTREANRVVRDGVRGRLASLDPELEPGTGGCESALTSLAAPRRPRST
jgi:hypothetical protein